RSARVPSKAVDTTPPSRVAVTIQETWVDVAPISSGSSRRRGTNKVWTDVPSMARKATVAMSPVRLIRVLPSEPTATDATDNLGRLPLVAGIESRIGLWRFDTLLAGEVDGDVD